MTKVDINLPANKREQLLFAVVLVFFVFVFFRVVHGPQAGRLENVKRQVSSLRFEKEALMKLSLPSAEKLHSLSRRKGVKMKILAGDITPVYRDVSMLLTRLTEPSLLGGLSIQDLNHQPPVKEKGYDRTDFKMKARGSFTDVLRYVEKMEEFPALFSLESLNVQVVEGQPQEVDSEIVGRFFRMEGGTS